MLDLRQWKARARESGIHAFVDRMATGRRSPTELPTGLPILAFGLAAILLSFAVINTLRLEEGVAPRVVWVNLLLTVLLVALGLRTTRCPPRQPQADLLVVLLSLLPLAQVIYTAAVSARPLHGMLSVPIPLVAASFAATWWAFGLSLMLVGAGSVWAIYQGIFAGELVLPLAGSALFACVVLPARRLGRRQVVEALERALSEAEQRRLLAEDVERRSRIDPLTGLLNRGAISGALERVWQRHQAGPADFAVLFLDLDDFKEVNDTLGHVAGDEVLVEIGRRLRDSLRPGDLIGRYGGDEVLVIADDVEASAVEELVHRLREVVAQPVSTHAGEARVGVSIGAVMAGEAESLSELLARADALMYQRKG